MLQDILVTGLVNGGVYALLAIGFSLVFGVARIVNIAHTAFYMLAAYCFYTLLVTAKLNVLLAGVDRGRRGDGARRALLPARDRAGAQPRVRGADRHHRARHSSSRS